MFPMCFLRLFVALFGLAGCFSDEVFDVADLSWQGFAHPANAVGGDDHVVFNSDASPFVLLKRRPDCRLEFFPIFLFPTKRHLVQRLRTNIDSRFVSEYNARYKLRPTTNVV